MEIETKNTIIYYFTGTGNSLFVANSIKKQLVSTDLRAIVSSINKNEYSMDAEAVGFVFPTYMMGIPLPLYEFIKKLNLDKTKYIFAVATRMGTSHGAFKVINKILKKKNRKLDAQFNINMCNNDIKFEYIAPTTEEIKKVEDVALKDIEVAIHHIRDRKPYVQEDKTATKVVPRFIVNMAGTMAMRINTKLHADSKCISCGTCEKVCLSGKVRLLDGKPRWDSKVMCYKCSACINYCPNQSSQIANYTEGKDRYSHPYASAIDIMNQK